MNILYVDGGGTKTAGYLVVNNELVDKFESGQGNINTNYDSALKHIKEVIEYFNQYEYDQLCIGVAGATTNITNKDRLFNEIKPFIKTDNYEVCADVELLAKMFIPKDMPKSLLVNLGTGTSSIYYDGNSYSEHLGWGRIINDLGSGYDIGIHVVKYLTICEDTNNKNIIYQTFLKDFETKNIREYVPQFSNPNVVANLSGWVVKRFNLGTKLFVIPRVKKALDYLSYLDVNNFYCTGSIFIKNKEVQEFVKDYLKDKNVFFVSLFN